MGEPNAYEQTLTNILRTVVNSSAPLYELQLQQRAQIHYPGGTSIVALQNVAIPRLRQIFNMVGNPNGFFAALRAVHDQGVGGWFNVPVHYLLILHVDMVLDEIYQVCRNIEDEIKRLRRKFGRADFISDLFQIVARDISGGALELQHRISQVHVQPTAPHRHYYEFHHKSASKSAVLRAIQKREEGTPLNISDYLELRHAIGRLTLQQTAIDDWLDELSNIYIEVAMKYGFLNLNDLLGYLFERQNRNADSHFSDYLQYFNSHDPHPCAAFINTDDYLRGEFDENETNLLEYTFERCCDDLRRNPRLFVGSTITVTPRINPQNRYNAYFMREMVPVNNYHIANSIVTVYGAQQRQEAEYWHPQHINADDVIIQFGHRVP